MAVAAQPPSKSAERRKQVFIGELSPDFLRITPPSTSGGISIDEETAAALQQRQNYRVAFGQNAFIPANTRGRLTLTIVQAKLAKNYGLVRMDPYCRVRVGSAVFETPTDHNGAKNPRWSRTVQCYLPNGCDSIFLEIFDERAFSTDERIAWGHIVIPEAVFNGEPIDDWYTLSGEQGEGKEGMVNLSMFMSPVDAAAPVPYVPMSQPLVLVQGGYGGYAMPSNWPIVQPVQPSPPVPAGPMFTEQDVKELADMFPNMDITVVQSVLEEKRGNKESAVNALLSMT